MELRQIAEQVLFATNLRDKLSFPENWTDVEPGPAFAAPQAPGRPGELLFKSGKSSSADFPGLGNLDREQQRGQVLHFFANHELLATELMALVLLRFPEAPSSFRAGVARTLREEQIHTRLYLERMRECGVHFGELPVSGYFWRSVSSMESPMDFVSALSLTFEQANLDFCPLFQKGFAEAGDTATAEILDRIYKDEIAHVAHGLKWFRRWKDSSLDDWQAFQHHLRYPLTPNRAKGPTLNIAGRMAAGLNSEFIAQLDVYSHSKGRTPRVYYFNPFSEVTITLGKSFTPSARQGALKSDLQILPQFLARRDDVLLVTRRPSVEFLSHIKRAGFPLPEFVEFNPNYPDPFSALRHRKLGGIHPWAWGPDSRELFRNIEENVSGDPFSVDDKYNSSIARLYSKAWSADLLRRLMSDLPDSHRCCSVQEIGVEVTTLDEALQQIAAIRESGHHRVIVKESVGLAGQNSIRLWEPEILEAQKRWIANCLDRGGSLVVEPWLDRVADFSVQLEMRGNELHLLGFTGLCNTRSGQFLGNWAEPGNASKPPGQIVRAFPPERGKAPPWLPIYGAVVEALAPELKSVGYRGPLGIDAFLFRDASGSVRLKPVVELNPRFTMGRLTLELMNYTAPGSTGRFYLVSRETVERAGHAGFPAFVTSLEQAKPLEFAGSPIPRIRSGLVCLTDPSQAGQCLALFEVRRFTGSPWEEISPADG